MVAKSSAFGKVTEIFINLAPGEKFSYFRTIYL